MYCDEYEGAKWSAGESDRGHDDGLARGNGVHGHDGDHERCGVHGLESDRVGECYLEVRSSPPRARSRDGEFDGHDDDHDHVQLNDVQERCPSRSARPRSSRWQSRERGGS